MTILKSSRSGSPAGKHPSAAVVLLPWVSPDPTTALPMEHSPALRLEGPTSGRSIYRRVFVRRPAWNVVLEIASYDMSRIMLPMAALPFVLPCHTFMPPTLILNLP